MSGNKPAGPPGSVRVQPDVTYNKAERPPITDLLEHRKILHYLSVRAVDSSFSPRNVEIRLRPLGIDKLLTRSSPTLDPSVRQ